MKKIFKLFICLLVAAFMLFTISCEFTYDPNAGGEDGTGSFETDVIPGFDY